MVDQNHDYIYTPNYMFTWLSFTSRRVSSLNFFGISTINNVPLCFGPCRPWSIHVITLNVTVFIKGKLALGCLE